MTKIIEHLKNGGVIIYPTETAYAIGCDATNQKAVDLVFKLKKRPKAATLPLITGSLAMVKKFCQISAAEERLAKKYWPGALTMVLSYSLRLDSRFRGNDNVGRSVSGVLVNGIVAKDGTVAVRVSGNKLARELSRRLNRPLVSTSANLHRQGECYSFADVRKSFLCHSRHAPCLPAGRYRQAGEACPRAASGSGNPEILFIDGGRLKKQKPSTIVKIESGKIKILRQGEIKLL